MRVTVLLLGFLQKMLALAAPTGQIQNVSLSVLLSLSPSKREGGSVLFFYVLIFFFLNNIWVFQKSFFKKLVYSLIWKWKILFILNVLGILIFLTIYGLALTIKHAAHSLPLNHVGSLLG